MAKAISQSKILERDRWYNFPGKSLSTLAGVAEALNDVIAKLNQIHPGLITEKVDLDQIQESVNKLHVHFADSHLVKQRITDQSYPLWFEFNNLLHAFEAVERSQQVESSHGMPNASIVFTWENNFRESLAKEDYSQFTIAKKFGTCYVNYCQVGRHIFEMFQAQDEDLSKEHVLPLRHVSADTYLWLGPSTGPRGFQQKSEAIQKWFLENQAYFSSLGMEWGDPELAIGWIPVATLRSECRTPEEQRQLIHTINRQQSLMSCIIEATEHN